MAKADKKVTLSLLVGTDIDVAAASSVAKKLSNILQKSGVNTAFSGKVVKDLEALSAKAEQLFKYEFSDKNPKQLQYMKKELDSFVNQMNSISDDINGAELVEALLPQAIFETKIREIEKEFKESKSRITSAHKKDKSSPLYDKNIAQMTVKAQSDIQVKYEKEASAVEELNRKLKENVDILEARYSALSKEEKKSDKGLTLEKNLQTAKEGLELSKKEHDQLLSRNREFGEFFKAFSTYKKEISAVTAAKEKQVTLAKEERKIAESKVTPAGKPVELESATNEFGQFKREVSETQASLESHNKELGKTSESAKYLGQQLARVTSATFLVAKGFQGLRAAVNIVKDLDKAMTGIAIVTNQTREEVWATYESFKSLADSLSATTQEIADAALLYYQQGLSTAEVMEVVKSTTIAAALAGIQFAEASDRMTAAIRGFDLEMQDSIRVTDSFSSLAAYTAADFNELSYAMTKTASIAHVANMTLENTAAFLAKMIETTREAPENIGTAMKSIIARMAQINTNPLQALEDGTDFNKVQGSLRTVGIELTDLQNKMRPFDEVFLELGQKWEYIDRNTQSYIATTIAGNRQQSRFLALMSDFDRTMEMVSISNNSAGESLQMFNTYVTGAEAASKRFKQSQINLANSFIKSDFIITMTQAMTDFVNVLSKIGPAGTLVAGTMGLMTIAYLKTKLSVEQLTGKQSALAIFLGLTGKMDREETKKQISLRMLDNKLRQEQIVLGQINNTLTQEQIALGVTDTALTEQKIANEMLLNDTRELGIVKLVRGVKAYIVSVKARSVADLKETGNLSLLNKVRTRSNAARVEAIALMKSEIATQTALNGARIAAGASLVATVALFALLGYTIYSVINHQKKYLEGLKETIISSREQADAAKNENQNLKALIKTYEELTEKISLNEEEKDSLLKTEEELLEIFPQLITGYDSEGKALYDNDELMAKYNERLKENNALRRENLSLALNYEFVLAKSGDYGDLFTEEQEEAVKQAGKSGGVSRYLAAAPYISEAQPQGLVESDVRLIQSHNDKKLKYLTDLTHSYSIEMGDAFVDGLELQEDKSTEAVKGYLSSITRSLIEEMREESGGMPGEFSRLMNNFEGEYTKILAALGDMSKIKLSDEDSYLSFFTEQINELSYGSIAEIEGAKARINNAIEKGLASGVLDEFDPSIEYIEKYTEQKAEEAQAIYKEVSKYLDSIGQIYARGVGASTLQGLKTVLEESSKEDLDAVKGVTAELVKKIGSDKNLSQNIEKAFSDGDVRTIQGLTAIKTALKETDLHSKTVDNLVYRLSKIDPVTFDSLSQEFDKIQNKISKTSELASEMLVGGLNAEQIKELVTLYPELANEIRSAAMGEGFEIDYGKVMEAQRALLQQQIVEAETALQIQASSAEEKFEQINQKMIAAGGKNYGWSEREKALSYWMESIADPEASKAIKGLTTDVELFTGAIDEMAPSEAVIESLYRQFDKLGEVNLKAALNAFGDYEDKLETLKEAQKELSSTGKMTVETLGAIVDEGLLEYLDLSTGKLQIQEGARENLGNAIKSNIMLTYMEARMASIIAAASSGKVASLKAVEEGYDGITAAARMAIATQLAESNLTGKQKQKARNLAEAEMKALYGSLNMNFGASSKSSGGGGGGGSKAEPVDIEPYYDFVQKLKKLKTELDKIEFLEELYEDDNMELLILTTKKIELLKEEQKVLHAANQARRKDIQKDIAELRKYGITVDYVAETNDLTISGLEALEGRTDKAAHAMIELAKGIDTANDANIEYSKQYMENLKKIKDATPTFEELFNRFKESEIDRLGWVQDDINFLRRKDEDILKWTKKIEEVEEKILEKRAESLEITEEEREIFIEKFGFMEHDIELLNEAELSYVEINRQIIEQKKLLQDLNNEKNKAVYHEDMGWVWETDQDAITKAEEDMDKLEVDLMKASVDVYNSEIDDKNKIYDDSVKTLQERMDDLRYEVDVTSRKIEFSYEDLIVHMHAYGLATKENLEMVSKSYDKNQKAIQTSTGDLAKGLQTTVAKLVQRINELAGTANFDFGADRVEYGPPGSKETNIGPTIHSTGSGYKSGDAKPGDYVATAGGIYRVNDKGVGEKMPNLGGVNVNASDSDWKSKVNESAEELKKKLKFKEGGIVDYTGDAAVHGSKAKPEVVFNSTDAKKLYDLVHNTDSLIPKIANSFDFQNGVPTNNIYNFDQLVLPNVKDGESFMSDLKRIRNIVSITGKN